MTAVARSRARDPYFDNAKFLGILLVVVGHFWTSLRDDTAVMSAYTFIYLFHMPAFIVIAGYFARGFDFAPRKTKRLVTGIVIPYVIFETAYSIYGWMIGERGNDISLLDPYFLTWFLMALFLWRVTAPIWELLRWPVAIAVVVALLAGVTNDVAPDILRALTLLPFFVVGLTIRPDVIGRLRGLPARAIAVATLVAGLVSVAMMQDDFDYEWIYWRADYATLEVSTIGGFVGRGLMLLVGFALTAAFLTLVPRRRTWFTPLGAGTLYAYLLHGFFVKAFTAAGWDERVDSRWAVLAITVAAVVLATALMLLPVRRAMRWAVEPTAAWLFRPDVDEPRRTRQRLRE